jgi:hypothetical protein
MNSRPFSGGASGKNVQHVITTFAGFPSGEGFRFLPSRLMAQPQIKRNERKLDAPDSGAE